MNIEINNLKAISNINIIIIFTAIKSFTRIVTGAAGLDNLCGVSSVGLVLQPADDRGGELLVQLKEGR